MTTAVRTRTCNLCEAMCGLLVTVEDGRPTGVRGDPDDVLSRGHLCAKGPALVEVWADPDRLRHPVRRTPSGWERVGWDEALDEAARRLSAVRAAHGRDAVGVYVGNPTVHNHGASLALPGFLKALGTRNRFDANSQDANPKLYVALEMYGDQLAITVPDVDRTDYLLMLGANPAASNGSLMSLGDVRGRLRGVRERGGRFVLVDPRRTETAAWADEHVFVRPGGDAPLLFALLHELLVAGVGRLDAAALGSSARGVAELGAVASRFPPERAAALSGVAPDVVRRIARELAGARRAVVYGRVGVCQNEFASLATWAIEALNVVLGSFDQPGGAMFATPALDVAAAARRMVGNGYDRWRSRVRGLPELAGQLPAAVMAEEMETPGAGQIRGFVTVAGNPVLSTPNGERLAAALARLDTYVAVDFYLNETTRHAHLVLPPMHALERAHYDVVFHSLAVRNTAKLSPAIVAPDDADARDDFAILYDLGMRLGGMRLGPRLLDRAARLAWRVGLVPSADALVDLLLRVGPHGDRFGLRPGGLSLARLAESPHGVDLGPLVPSRRTRVRTADGRVDLAPPRLVADLARLERRLDAAARDGDLVLIGRRHVRTNNSWMHNCASLVKGPDRSSLLVHPDDAARLGLVDGAAVRVSSRVGAVSARVAVSDEVMRGVVSLPHGYGHAAAAATLRVAGRVAGPNVNALTDETLLDVPSGTAALSGVPVRVEIEREPLPIATTTVRHDCQSTGRARTP